MKTGVIKLELLVLQVNVPGKQLCVVCSLVCVCACVRACVCVRACRCGIAVWAGLKLRGLAKIIY